MTEPEFRIREGTSADVAAAAEIFRAAFADDWIFNKMHPHRKEHPEDFRAWAHRFFYARYWGPEQQLFYVLTVPDAASSSGERVVAFAWWRRPYPTEAEKSAHEGWFTVRGWLKPVLLGINSFTGYLWPPKSRNLDMIDAFDDSHIASDPLINDSEHPKRKTAWYLSTLGVLPECQGKGYGSLLVRHSLRRVDEEGVPAWLIGLKGVEPFYERLGFEVKGRANVGRLADWDGGSIMFKE